MSVCVCLWLILLSYQEHGPDDTAQEQLGDLGVIHSHSQDVEPRNGGACNIHFKRLADFLAFTRLLAIEVNGCFPVNLHKKKAGGRCRGGKMESSSVPHDRFAVREPRCIECAAVNCNIPPA